MNAKQRRVARRALGRKYGVVIPPGHTVNLVFAGVEYATSVGAEEFAVCEPVAINYRVEVVLRRQPT